MWSSCRAVVKGWRASGVDATDENTPRTDRDVPAWVVVVVPLVVIVTLVAVPGLLAGNMSLLPRLVAAIGVAIFGVAVVVVSSRTVRPLRGSSEPTPALAPVTPPRLFPLLLLLRRGDS